jgi:hypothetical protein
VGILPERLAADATAALLAATGTRTVTTHHLFVSELAFAGHADVIVDFNASVV